MQQPGQGLPGSHGEAAERRRAGECQHVSGLGPKWWFQWTKKGWKTWGAVASGPLFQKLLMCSLYLLHRQQGSAPNWPLWVGKKSHGPKAKQIELRSLKSNSKKQRRKANSKSQRLLHQKSIQSHESNSKACWLQGSNVTEFESPMAIAGPKACGEPHAVAWAPKPPKRRANKMRRTHMDKSCWSQSLSH